VLTAASCQSGSIKLTDADTKLRTIGDAIIAIHADSPNLVGFKDHEIIAGNAFRGRNEQETALLIGRVYLDTTQNLSRRVPIGTPYLPPTGDLLHHVQQQMEQHRNLDHLSRAYFDGLLTDTRSRASSDPKYARAVNEAVQAARYNWNSGWDDYQCYIDGIPWPMIACRTLLLCDMVDAF
jgi:hypothetical protein